MAGRSVLVSVYGSGNLLAAMASVRWQGELSGRGPAEKVVVLVHPPVPSAEMVRANGEVVERLIGSQGWPAPIVLTAEDIAEITGESRRFERYDDVLERFRGRIGEGGDFDEIHFAHDMVGRVPELAMNAFPRAERIMYGDTLGSVYDPAYFMALARGATIDEARREAAAEKPSTPRSGTPRAALRGLRELALGAPRQFAPDRALLVLPMDQTGSALDDTPMSVIPREVVLQIVSECQAVLPELAAYAQGIAEDTSAPRYLLLLENYADADMTSFDDEVAMYEAVVRKHAPAGATVLLKTHPLAVAPVHDALCERLTADYSMRVIPRELARYPMELWNELISSCEIISMLSYCGISLSFLYGKKTIYPVDVGIVERFFPRRSWERMKDSDALYRGQLDGLATWDGTGLLWKGTLR